MRNLRAFLKIFTIFMGCQTGPWGDSDGFDGGNGGVDMGLIRCDYFNPGTAICQQDECCLPTNCWLYEPAYCWPKGVTHPSGRSCDKVCIE